MLITKMIKDLWAHRVVESGTTGIWTYKKYADGTFKCFGSSAITSSSSSTTKSATITLPFTAADAKYTVSATPTTNGTILMRYGIQTAGGSTGKSAASFTIFGTITQAATDSIGIDFVVEGKWK